MKEYLDSFKSSSGIFINIIMLVKWGYSMKNKIYNMIIEFTKNDLNKAANSVYISEQLNQTYPGKIFFIVIFFLPSFISTCSSIGTCTSCIHS